MGTVARLSHSTVSDLLDLCAYRVGLNKIVGLDRPTNGRLAVGTAYHAAIEMHEHTRRAWRRYGGTKGAEDGVPVDTMLEAARTALALEDVEWEDDDLTLTDAIGMVEAAVTHWYETPIPDGQAGAGGSLRDRVLGWQPIAVETWWDLWLPPDTSLPIRGACDCVYLKPDGTLVVVDHKSANRFGKWRLDAEGIRDQAAMYVLAAKLSPKLPVWRDVMPEFEYHIARTETGKTARFEGARVVQVDVDQVDLDYVQDRVGSAHLQVLEDRWDKNPDAWICTPKWCPFHQDAGGPCDPHAPNEYDIAAYVD